ncbi:protein stand still [Drosophila pseudoobscura]|uniref:Protein stand still n=1 Tax=Drosophila pseudoobscura pseudoobscura TaxID=46245 RepID=A0A6I8UV70_DROPS|nr:protein stand still [Drosophila pseudoobscura]
MSSDSNNPEVRSEVDLEQRQHVPYILNGELYSIESQIGDNVVVKCCNCPPDRVYRGSVRSTGNFHMHIKRRHASLLGKLHEMKVAALEERRDRIMKNRGNEKPRRKRASTSPCKPITRGPVAAASAPAAPAIASSAPTANETHELKIKTVFQRHQQEHSEQKEETGTKTPSPSVSGYSTLDHNENHVNQAASKMPNCTDNSTNIGLIVQHVRTLPNLHPSTVETLMANYSQLTPVAAVPQVLPLRPDVKEEQPSNSPSPIRTEQPVAIDLTTASIASSQSDGISSLSSKSYSLEDVQMAPSVAHYMDGPPRDILQRLERTMTDISQELRSRNQIEHNRLLLEAAKFKFLNPDFQFQPTF